jgi:DNA-binding NtrC family response regulator
VPKKPVGGFDVRPVRNNEYDQPQLTQEITALFVHDHGEHLARFEEFLRLRKIEPAHARNCEEASRALQQDSPPLLIFTDTRLADGSFRDIVYMEAMERGAFDFLTPNMEPSRFPAILLSAASEAMNKRSQQSQ